MNKQKLDPEKLHLQLTRMWCGEKGSEVKSENLNTTHARNCLHRGMWNGQQYNRSLHTLMCSAITSHNNIIKLPLTWTRSIVEGPSVLTPNLVGRTYFRTCCPGAQSFWHRFLVAHCKLSFRWYSQAWVLACQSVTRGTFKTCLVQRQENLDYSLW